MNDLMQFQLWREYERSKKAVMLSRRKKLRRQTRFRLATEQQRNAAGRQCSALSLLSAGRIRKCECKTTARVWMEAVIFETALHPSLTTMVFVNIRLASVLRRRILNGHASGSNASPQGLVAGQRYAAQWRHQVPAWRHHRRAIGESTLSRG